MTREVNLVSYLPPFLAEFKENTNALEAENPEFALIWKSADRVLNNEFIATADEYGISRYEKLLNILPSKEDTLEIRRIRVQALWVKSIPITLRTIIEKLEILCSGDYSVRTGYDKYEITIITHFERLEQSLPVQAVINSLVPANMNVIYINNVHYEGKASVFTAVINKRINKHIRTEVKVYGME